MNSFLEALNHPAEAFRSGKKEVSWTIVGITILLNSVFEPILQHFFGASSPVIDAKKMLKITALGVLSYVVICVAFWLVCKSFGSKMAFKKHLSAWGATYFPTALCSVVVAITEVLFYVFWNSTIWGMLLNFVFIGILIWKVILYFVYLKEFVGLKGWRFIGVSILMGVVILLMATVSGYLGIKTPII